MLEHISGAYETIVDLGETYDNLLENTFNTLLTTPNTRFNQNVSLQNLSWKGGNASCDFYSLARQVSQSITTWFPMRLGMKLTLRMLKSYL